MNSKQILKRKQEIAEQIAYTQSNKHGDDELAIDPESLLEYLAVQSLKMEGKS